MPRSSGTYTRTNGVHTGSTVWAQDEAAGTDILSTRMDVHDQDVADAITASLAKDGQTNPTANLPMATYKHTGVGAGTALTDYADVKSAQNSTYVWCGTAGGSKNALTLTPSPAITAYVAGQRFYAIIGGTSSDDAVTAAVSGLATKAVEIDGAACSATVQLITAKLYVFIYDGTAFQATRLSHVFGTFAEENIAAVPAMTLAGKVSAADQEIERPKFTDYGETVNAIGSTGGGTQDIDITLGNVVSATVDTSTNTFTFSNPSATGIACSFTLFLTNGGSQTVNWPASVDWAGGTAPTLTTSGVDIITFTTIDAGTIWYGFAAGLDMQ